MRINHKRLVTIYKLHWLWMLFILAAGLGLVGDSQLWAQQADVANSLREADLGGGGGGIFGRALTGGVIVFTVLILLISLSVLSWGIVVSKWVYLKRVESLSDKFIKSFWDSRSLNDLNGRLADFPYSPMREVFRSGYAELIRGTQLKDQTSSSELALHVAVDNLTRALAKARAWERKKMEKYLSFLAITASASPFVGLFGTVWGIMGAFEGIARTGSASLAAVAPGISEALIATAFGLAAAIPAVVGYNIFSSKIRGQMIQVDGFTSDFLNIVERFLVTDRPKSHGASVSIGG